MTERANIFRGPHSLLWGLYVVFSQDTHLEPNGQKYWGALTNSKFFIVVSMEASFMSSA
jgi:hypothetical protein